MPNISYAVRAVASLKYLWRLFGGSNERDHGIELAVEQLFRGWGDRTWVEDKEGRRGTTPFEYSVVLSEGHADLRIFFRPQAASGATTSIDSWRQGWAMLDSLSGIANYDLSRAESIRDIYVPTDERAAIGLCIGASIGASGVSGAKIYFDGIAKGISENRNIVTESMTQLGYERGHNWLIVKDALAMSEIIPMVSLDLVDHPTARFKIYSPVSASEESKLEARLEALPGYSKGSGERFISSLTKSHNLGLVGRGAKPVLCWSFTEHSFDHPSDATLYYPFRQAVPDLTHASEALRPLLHANSFKQVDHLFSQMQLLDQDDRVNPFHWAAVKLAGEQRAITVYASADVIDPLASKHIKC